jgi:hypothetical protein
MAFDLHDLHISEDLFYIHAQAKGRRSRLASRDQAIIIPAKGCPVRMFNILE